MSLIMLLVILSQFKLKLVILSQFKLKNKCY